MRVPYLSDRGTVAVGMRAEPNIVTGDMLDLATHGDRLTHVIKRGVIARRNSPGDD